MEQAPPAYSEKPGGYPPPGQPGYPPSGQPGYPPPGQPGCAPPPSQGYPAQQPGYAPQPQQGGYPAPPPAGSTVVVQPNVVVGGFVPFNEYPRNVQCNSCHANVVTAVEYVTGTLTWLAAGFMFLVGLGLCCWIPCLIDGCKDAVHKCPNCHNVIGIYKRL